MTKPNRPGSDTGIIIFHWGVVAFLLASLLTGLRIGADAEGRTWLSAVAFALLPDGDIWPYHLWSGLGLASLALGYAIYVRRSRLGSHLAIDFNQLANLNQRGKSRWISVHVLMTWALFVVLAVQLYSGFALYLGRGGSNVTLHYVAALCLLAFPFLHVACQACIGGAKQLLRIFRPLPLAEESVHRNFTGMLLEAYLQQEAKLEAIRARPAKVRVNISRQETLYVHPLAMAGGIAAAFAMTMVTLDRGSHQQLQIAHVEGTEAPKIDGELSDPVWQRAIPVRVETMQGANFGGQGQSVVDVRAVHDGKYGYFAFTWDDPTRSLKHLPLIKKEDGWHLVHEQYDIEDEDLYYEDKLGVMFSHSREPAGGSMHLGQKPLAALPAAYSGRGLHYMTDGDIVDVWHWKASRGGLLGYVDDNYFGAPVEPKPEELEGRSRYKAGYVSDPGKAFYKSNFKHEPAGGYVGPIKPERLPKDLTLTTATMGRINLTPDIGEDESAQWWLTEADSVPYSQELDNAIPVGTVIPGVLITGKYEGDRADVNGAARWAAGRWTLEARRLLDTGNKGDLPVASGLALWISPFDHSQTRHTRHMRPVILEVEQ